MTSVVCALHACALTACSMQEALESKQQECGKLRESLQELEAAMRQPAADGKPANGMSSFSVLQAANSQLTRRVVQLSENLAQ